MNTLFPYSPPERRKKDALKALLLKEHVQLYGEQKSASLSWIRSLLFVPAYVALILFVGFSSLVTVHAFSPEAEVYGKIYGPFARLSMATQGALSTLRIAPAPSLPGLTVEETKTLGNTQDLGIKAYLSSKIARTLPTELQTTVDVPTTGTLPSTPSIVHIKEEHGTLTLLWDEVRLPSGALPAYYTVERKQENAWVSLGKSTTSTFNTSASFGKNEFQIHVVDWQGSTLPFTLHGEFTNTTPTTTTTPQEQDTSKGILDTPAQEIEKKKEEVAYDFKDKNLPALSFALQLTAKLSGSSLTLHWQTPEVAVHGYNVYKDNIKLNLSTITSTSFVDSSITGGKTYQYQVRAVDKSGKEIGKSDKVSITAPLIPVAPKALRAELSQGHVLLHWDEVKVSDVAGYVITRTNLGTNTTNTFSAKSTSYEDTSALGGNEYLYSIKTKLSSGSISKDSAATSISLP